MDQKSFTLDFFGHINAPYCSKNVRNIHAVGEILNVYMRFCSKFPFWNERFKRMIISGDASNLDESYKSHIPKIKQDSTFLPTMGLGFITRISQYFATPLFGLLIDLSLKCHIED